MGILVESLFKNSAAQINGQTCFDLLNALTQVGIQNQGLGCVFAELLGLECASF
jgi:hypothetical protein